MPRAGCLTAAALLKKVMNKSPFSLLVISIVLATFTMTPAFAGSKKKAKAEHRTTVISNVGPNTITVTEGNASKTYTFNQFTEVNVNGQKATIADLKGGMVVNVTLTDPSRVSRINATDPRK